MKQHVKLWLGAAALSVGLGCATGMSGLGMNQPAATPMQADARIPAAAGSVHAAAGQNDNTAVQVRVQHLAPPDKVEPGAATYVVWAQAPGGASPPQNLGALKVDRELNGSLTALTPMRSFELFITAEPTALATAPTGDQLLRATVERSG